MKSLSSSIKRKLTAKYVASNNSTSFNNRSTNINVLLNRVKLDQKNETRRKIYFSALASTGLILFTLIVFS